MPLRILINGAGVAGPALATMLLSSSSPSYQITIVERAPDLRTGGQQIDLRAQAIPILKRCKHTCQSIFWFRRQLSLFSLTPSSTLSLALAANSRAAIVLLGNTTSSHP